MKLLCLFLICILYTVYCILQTSPVYATVDPLSTPNNKVGIHVISATIPEAEEASKLVNPNGDWGYITVLVESKDRDVSKWQTYFNYLRRQHLIPILRLATQPEGEIWKRPYDGEEVAWADFLNNLNWPTKNRYIIIYNEPNHGREWGSSVDAKDYTLTLDKTISALKEKSDDFFVMAAGLDASAPQKLPDYQDEKSFLNVMNETVPGIFNKLDGLSSHSYPNPNFAGSPNATGRGTVRTWEWELQTLKELGLTKSLPVFITETGWKHAEGQAYDRTVSTAQRVSEYFKTAFNSAWSSDQIVAVTPFIFNYQNPPFDHFSFQMLDSATKISPPEKANTPLFYPQYKTLIDLPKTHGKPTQDYKAKVVAGSIYNTLVSGESYVIPITVQNTGQSIWNESDQVKLVPKEGGQLLENEGFAIPITQKVEPGTSFAFNLKINAKQLGVYKVALDLYHGSTKFNMEPIEFTTEIKSPVILKVKATLKWKDNSAGEYILSFAGLVTDTIKNIVLNPTGFSDEIAVKSILPDNSYDFTLQKPFYQSKTIHQQVSPGVNTLDFDQLQPDLPSAILHPTQLWQLLPFSN